MMKIICLGDSLTYGYMLARKYAWPSILGQKDGWTVINEGISGDTTGGMLARLPQILEERPDKLILMGASNDLFCKLSVEVPFANLRSMAMQAVHWRVEPVLLNPPRIIEEIDQDRLFNQGLYRLGSLLEEECIERNWSYLDLGREIRELEDFKGLYLDGVHFNREGNAEIAKIIEKIL